MHHRTLPLDTPVAPRGVYRHDWFRNSCFVFYAVDSRGECVGELNVDGVRLTEDAAERFLADILDLCDPTGDTVLRIVKPSSPHRGA